MMLARPEGCVSDFLLDRHLARETAPAEDVRLDEHLRSCARCGARLRELRAERDAFAREAPALKLEARRTAPSRGRWFGGAAGLLGLAAAATLILHGAGPGGTRTKGSGAFLGVYVKHEGAVRAGEANERVEPGDAIRFVHTANEPRYLAILSLDGARHASVYYPDASVAARVEAGAAIALPASTVLDDVLGSETIFGVSCRTPFDIEPLRRELQTSGGVGAPDGCDVNTLSLRKEAPAGR